VFAPDPHVANADKIDVGGQIPLVATVEKKPHVHEKQMSNKILTGAGVLPYVQACCTDTKSK
jgi:hypothetical protein